jgi:serine/threonine protein kinase
MPSQIPPSGTFAGRYTIERELGRGGTATVYLAQDTSTTSSVALKVLRRELVESVAADHFLREFRMNAGIRHPHITPILNSGQFGADLFLVMPHMESGSLRTRLEKDRQLSVESVVDVVRAIGSALQHAHELGFIHRDVKPENILFSGDEAYLSDFGIARAVERVTGDSTTSSGIVRGTPAYMSPEQASGEHQLDGRSDQFSFACVVYEMLAGLPAFQGPTQESTIALRFRHPARSISVYRPDVPAVLERVLEKAMSLVPTDRFADMGAFVAAFEGGEIEARVPETGAVAPLVKSHRKSIALVVAILATAGLALYAAAHWLY